jgi:hypothetical protein
VDPSPQLKNKIGLVAATFAWRPEDSGHFQPAHCAGRAGEFVRVDSHPLDDRDEQVAEVVIPVVLPVERELLAVFEPAARQNGRHVETRMLVGVAEI